MTALRMAAALAAALAAAPAAAYVRTRAVTTGLELAWRVPVVPWSLSRGALDADPPHIAPSCVTSVAGDPALEAIRASFAAWEQPCAELHLPYAGTLPEIRVGVVGPTENVLVFREGWCTNLSPRPACYDDWDVDCGGIYNCFEDHTSCPSPPCADRSVVALTSVLYDPRTGRIYDADIEINGWDGAAGSLAGPQPGNGWYFTCYPDPEPLSTCTTYGQDGCKFIDLQNTVTHEVGHFLGLAHPCGHPGLPACTQSAPEGEEPYLARTMSPTTNVGETLKRSLSDDDVAGVCAIYPPSGGGCGCGSGGAPGMLALLAAAAALRRPRRPR